MLNVIRNTFITLICVLSFSIVVWAEEKPEQPTQTAPPAEVPAWMIKEAQLNAKFDDVKFAGWELMPLNAGETISQDEGGWRSELLKYNLGFWMMNLSELSYNLRDAPMRGMPIDITTGKRGAQIYEGQKATSGGPQVMFLVYSASKNIKIHIDPMWGWTTWTPNMGGNQNWRVGEMYMESWWLNHRLELSAGYMPNDGTFYIGYLNGSIGAGTLGLNAVLPYVVGQNHGGEDRPNVYAKYNWTKHFYTQLDVQESISSYGNGYSDQKKHDALGLRFHTPNSGILNIMELDYKKESAPGEKKVFARATGWFNTAQYFDYSRNTPLQFGEYAVVGLHAPGVKLSDNNWLVSGAIDKQLSQPSQALPFRGLYMGGSFQYLSKQQNPMKNYTEWRNYYIGPFKSRPMDLIVATASWLQFSHQALEVMSQVAPGSSSRTDLRLAAASSAPAKARIPRHTTCTFARVCISITASSTPCIRP